MLPAPRKFSVRFSQSTYDRIETEARRLALRPSDVVRDAVDRYFGAARDDGDSAFRHHQISEFSQVALDKIITEQYPQFRGEILAETNRRMEKYHAR